MVSDSLSSRKLTERMIPMKKWLYQHRHACMFLYFLIYLPWFAWLEKTVGHSPDYIIHMKIDDFIPFNEYFIIPYMLWFGFVAFWVVYFFFKDTKEFYQLTCFLFIGMTIFLIVSTLFPNGQQLRPTEFVRDNIFVDMVKYLYSVDTPTNIAPSIHVYNSLCIYLAVQRSSYLKEHMSPRLRYITYITTGVLSLLIVLSTMFLKQHSAFDVITAFIMCGVVYRFIYRHSYQAESQKTEPSIENI